MCVADGGVGQTIKCWIILRAFSIRAFSFRFTVFFPFYFYDRNDIIRQIKLTAWNASHWEGSRFLLPHAAERTRV